MLLLGLLILYPFLLQFLYINQKDISIDASSQGNLHTSGLISSNSTQWLNNTEFDNTAYWTASEGGDPSDIYATIDNGAANFTVIGETHTFSEISGIPLDSEWNKTTNPSFPALPDDSEIRSYGCWVTHAWSEQADQSPSVQWERNITMPVDMSEYIITSASINAVFNATVDDNIDSVADLGEPDIDDHSTWDYARFYVLISDLQKEKIYEIAYNQTTTLGDDDHGATDYLSDTNMTAVLEKDLIFYLTSVLSTDNRNFTIALGIRIWSEDNILSDSDSWTELVIRSCSLNFTYEKKITQLTSASWSQGGEKISDLSSDYNVIVTDARLNFSYKINQDWPTALSPNAEIRALFNTYPHTETIKLKDLNQTYQEISLTGWDVTTLITDYVNFSFQIYLTDEFNLDYNITISIDNISLWISYDLRSVDPAPPTPIDWSPLVIGLGITIVALIVGYTSYLLYFRYPPMVRTIKSLRRKIKKGKRINAITVEERQDFIKRRLREQRQILKIEARAQQPKKSLNGKVLLLFFLIILFPFMMQIFPAIFNYRANEGEGLENLRVSTEELGNRQWLDYNTFTSQGIWYSSEEIDPTDVDTSIGGGMANFEILGDKREFSEVSGVIKNESYSDGWRNTTNSYFPLLPDNFGIDDYGCYVYHDWRDGEDSTQSPSIHWDRNITMPVDMSDYIITSASISAVANATVHAFPGNDGSDIVGGIEIIGDTVDNGGTQYATYDYVKFYVLVSDVGKKDVFEIASFQTSSLGNDTKGAYDNITATFLESVPEETLIFYITSALAKDNYNFTITVGMRIFCEDNWNWDDDVWDDLRILSCDLNFTYEKKITQLTTVSWNQDASKISALKYYPSNTIIVLEANLNFYYKIDQEWPTALSPNSAIRVLINDKIHTETIKLGQATTSFQEAKEGGFNFYDLVKSVDDVNFSIQVYLGDEFELNRSITVSVDNVNLRIWYKIIGILPPPVPGIDWTPLTLGLITLLVGLVIVFTSYQLYFRFPPIIRRVRSLRRKIRRNKKTTPILVSKRDAIVKKRLREQLQILRIQPEIEKAGTSVKPDKVMK